MGEVIAVYADGGLMKANPSPIGGMWACCHVNVAGERVWSASGLILASGGISAAIQDAKHNHIRISICYDCVYEGLSHMPREQASRVVRICSGKDAQSLPEMHSGLSDGGQKKKSGIQAATDRRGAQEEQKISAQSDQGVQRRESSVRLLWPERLVVLDHRSHQWRRKSAPQGAEGGGDEFVSMARAERLPSWFPGVVPQLQLSEVDVRRAVSPCWICGRFDLVIGNNTAEFRALLAGLEALPDGWSGKVCTDSLLTIRRFREPETVGLGGIPDDWRRRMANVLGRLGRIVYVLLDGHPSRAQIAEQERLGEWVPGPGKRGNPVSKWNRWCDEECTRIGREYLGVETKPKRARKGEAA